VLALPALFADGLILIGLVAVATVAIQQLVNHGIADTTSPLSSQSSIFLGTAIYSFEGIGNVMPIYNSMHEKERFCNVFIACMVGITTLFVSFALAGYLAYGSSMQTVAVFVLPDTIMGNSIQIAYAGAIALSFPLVLLPATRICADAVFRQRLQPTILQKMLKNVFIVSLVAALLFVSWVGQSNLDHLVAFVGSFCCVPLGLLYPPCMHLRAFPQQSIWSKAVKYMELVLGLFCMVFTSYVALSTF